MKVYWLISVLFFIAEAKAQFTAYNAQNSLLPDNTIRCIAASCDSSIWIGTDNGLAHFKNDVFTIYQIDNSAIPDNNIRCIGIASDSAIWVGTFLNGLAVIKNNTVATTYTTVNSSLPSNFVRCIAFDTLGKAWIGTSNGIVHIADTGFVIYNMSNTPLATNNIISLHIDKSNVKWFGTLNGGFVKYDDNTWTIYNIANSSLPDNTIADIKEDHNNILWLSTPSAAIVQFNRISWNFLNPLNSVLPDYSINQIAFDENNIAYIATKESGLAKFSGNQQWHFFNESNSNIAENNLTCIAIDLSKRIWAGTALKGFMLFDETITTTQADADVYPAINIYPNPVSECLYLQTNNSTTQIQSVILFGTDGKIIHSETPHFDNNILRNIASLPQGIYLLKVELNNGTFVFRKIAKQ